MLQASVLEHGKDAETNIKAKNFQRKHTIIRRCVSKIL